MPAAGRRPTPWRDSERARSPMLATLAEVPLDSPRLVFEPKYDGIRTIVTIDPRSDTANPIVTLRSRQGNVKNVQFPELVDAFEALAARRGVPLVIDGEIVALDESDTPASFLRIQGRLHLTKPADVERARRLQPVAFYAFDILRDADEDVRALPFSERRTRLVRRLRRTGSPLLRVTESVTGKGRAMYERAASEGWEGLIAKDPKSIYASGRRSPAWRKIKLTRTEPFCIGGWTPPRGSRRYFGALLLGARDGNRLVHVGQTGSGFTQAELERVAALLAPLEIDTCPFDPPLRSGTGMHWVEPRLVADVKYTEWTADGKLRHPIYLGLREDVAGGRVRRARTRRKRVGGPAPASRPRRATRRAAAPPPSTPPPFDTSPEIQLVIDQLQALEDRHANGTILLPEAGARLKVTNLHKPFWPELGITKGDLLRYYARVASLILPVVRDRPLVMKRFPDGIHGNAFYQQRRVREAPPPGARIEPLPEDIEPIEEEGGGRPDRFVGGSLLTLLYMTQMAAISQDPWFSQVGSLEYADHVAIDLDPMEGVPFTRVLDVARWVRDELEMLETPGFPKTSGSRGLHIYVPLPPETSYESGLLFCQIVATVVATRHPKVATVARSVSARGQTVYVDYLQNILGKTLATAYSARASDYAGVSTPLTWDEVDEGVDPRDFTIRTAPARFEAVGDLWCALRTSPPADLRKAFRYAELMEGQAGRGRHRRARRTQGGE